ncbi:MAG: hypothetical protein ABL959_24960 [Pyrinomonadaceae bacterium]
MSQLRTLTILLVAVMVFAGSAVAQKKTTKKPAPKKPAPTVKIVPPLDVRAAREKVDIQLSNVNDFITKFGPIAQGMDQAEADRVAGKLSAKTAASIETSKQRLVDAIRGLRTGLSDLESEFRTKATLQKYLPNIQGITDLVERSEDSAIAGKFVAAKDPLRDLATKLKDTLAVLPR